MNISIGNRSNPGIRSTALSIVALAAAATVTLSTIVGLPGSSGAGDARATVQPQTPATRWVTQPAHRLEIVLVANAEEQARLEAAIAADEHQAVALGIELSERPMVLIKGSPLVDAIISASGDVIATGISLSVLDATLLANPETPPAAGVQADIMASVISTERAAYGGGESVQPMFGTAADAEYAAQSLR